MANSDEKFEQIDLPVILATIKKARDAKKHARLTVDFSNDGGIVSVQLETKERIK